MSAVIVTCWYRDVGDGLHFNHLANGFHADHDEPAYLFDSQRVAWNGGVWIGVRGELVNGVVIGGEQPGT